MGVRDRADGSAGRVQAAAREIGLQAGLLRLNALFLQQMEFDELLDQIAHTAVHAIPGAEFVGLMLLRADQGDVAAFGRSGSLAHQISLIEHEIARQGPALLATQLGQTVVSDDLGVDARWPGFGARVAMLGIRSVLTIPLQAPSGATIGVMSVYSRSADAFDLDAARIGQTLAARAGAALPQAQLVAQIVRRAADLEAQLTSRAVTDQAIGILRSRSGCTEREGYAELSAIGQRDHTSVAAAAEKLVSDAASRARVAGHRRRPNADQVNR